MKVGELVRVRRFPVSNPGRVEYHSLFYEDASCRSYSRTLAPGEVGLIVELCAGPFGDESLCQVMIGEEIGWVFRRELESVNSEDGMVG